MATRLTHALILFGVILLLAGCTGGAMTNGLDAVDNTADEFSFIDELEGVSKGASATYSYYFRDGIGWKTLQTWDILSNSGSGVWNYNATEAIMQFGPNYGPSENDELITPAFTLPANTADIKLVFQTRFGFGAGDSGKVQFSGNSGATWTDLATFTGTSGAGATPPWIKRTYFLPTAGNNVARTSLLRFVFTSDSATAGHGWAINSLAVYKTDVPATPVPSAPTNLTKSVGPYAGTTRLSWTQAGTQPQTYRIYRAPAQSGPYTLYAEIQGSLAKLTVSNSSAGWYQVKGFASGSGETAATNSVQVP